MLSEIGLTSVVATVEFGCRLAALLRAGDLVVLDGPLGSGKTTLARGIGEGLGIRGPVTSPTFVIARVHPSLVGGPALVHVDAYRIETLDDIAGLDLDASLDDCVTLVEWGADRVEHLSDSRLHVSLRREIGEDGDGSFRALTIAPYGPAWSSRLNELRELTGQ
jgi:tRNA threonylcarbamoyl adenosine modification protein YjeE